MAHRTGPVIRGRGLAPSAGLEPDAIGVAQDAVIGMATAAPAVSVGLTIAVLASYSAYGSPAIVVLTAIPMLIMANAYRKLNSWNANCGAAFEWVGRAINPYLGFLTGWLMIAANVVATVSGVIVLGPSVLSVFGSNATAAWPNLAITSLVIIVMLVIAVFGIRLTARTQVGMAIVEYTILVGFAVVGLYWVLTHHAGTFAITRAWFSPTGIGGKGSMALGFLTAIFCYVGWDATVNVNEEVKRRYRNPGRAAIIAMACLTVIYTLSFTGLQGVVSPAKLQANSANALVFIAQAMGGSGWAKVMAFALALSVIATAGTSIVVIARILYNMSSYRTFPAFMSQVSPRFSTPIPATLVTGFVLLALGGVYLLATSVQSAFDYTIADSGVLYISFYVMTALATIVYFRHTVLTSFWNALSLGVLPIGAACFLTWIVVKSMMSAPAAQNWALAGIAGLGVLMLLSARFVQRSTFFGTPRESDSGTR